MKTVFIYALNDPTRQHLGKTRYIGKAKDPYARYEEHLEKNYREKTYKANWIRSLLSKGRAPVLEVLDEVPENEWQLWECEWIRLYRALGFALTNATDGGDGAYNPSPEIRLKIGSARRGKPMSPEAREKSRISHLGQPGFWKGKKFSSEMREKLSLAHRGKPSGRRGCRMPPEAIEKMRATKIGIKQSAAQIEKRRATLIGRARSPEACLRISAGLKKSWEERKKRASIQ